MILQKNSQRIQTLLMTFIVKDGSVEYNEALFNKQCYRNDRKRAGKTAYKRGDKVIGFDNFFAS